MTEPRERGSGNFSFAVLVALFSASVTTLLTLVIQLLTGQIGQLVRLEMFRIPKVLLRPSGLTGSFVEILPAPIWREFDLLSVRGIVSYSLLLLGSRLIFYFAMALTVAAVCAVFTGVLEHAGKSRSAASSQWVLVASLTLLVATLGVFVSFPPGLLRWLKYILAGATWLGLVLLLTRTSRPQTEAILKRTTKLATSSLAILIGSSLAAALFRPDTRFETSLEAKPGAANFLLISIDSLRADHLGCYGYDQDTSPNLDRIASEGIMFTRAFAPTSWTLPSHMTVLTGLPPEGHGVVDDGQGLAQGVSTLAEILQARGYVTAGFVSGPYLHSRYGFNRGFAHYDDYSVVSPNNKFSHRDITSPTLWQHVADWLDAWNEKAADSPFFLFVHMWDVHYDFIPPPPYDRMFDPDYLGNLTGENFARSEAIHPEMDSRDLEHLVALYDGEVRFTDHHVGLILEELAELRVLDDTLVVVISDHGEEFFEHGEKGHRKNLFQETVQVPLLARWPGRLSAGAVNTKVVSLVDLMPWAVALLEIEPKPRVHEFAAPNLQRFRELREDPSTFARDSVFGDLHDEEGFVLDDKHKLVVRYDTPGKEQLFDLSLDSGETRNLARERAGTVLEMRKRLDAWRKLWSKYRGSAEEVELEEADLEQLRALGYID